MNSLPSQKWVLVNHLFGKLLQVAPNQKFRQEIDGKLIVKILLYPKLVENF